MAWCATAQLLDRIPGDLSYFLRLLIGLGCVEGDHGGWLTAMFEEDQKTVWETVFLTNGVGPQVVVEGDPASDTGFGLRPGFPGMQVDAFVFQGPPEAR